MKAFYMDNMTDNNIDTPPWGDTDGPFTSTAPSTFRVLLLIIICPGLPLTLLAIYSLYFLVRKDHSAPVYVINLLLSDVLQMCCFICLVFNSTLVVYLYLFGEMASVGFMVCVALERYLVVGRPLWYHFSRSIHMSMLVCVLVWLLPLVYVLPLYFGVDSVVIESIFAVYHLLPLPLFIFFLVGTFRALSKATRLPLEEKRRIVCVLVLVFVIYFLLFLPTIIWSLVEEFRENELFSDVASFLLFLSPVADLFLYVFIRKGALYKLFMCFKVQTNDGSSSV